MTRELLPLTEVVEPHTIDELADAVKTAASRGLAIYPIGGGTSLDYGLPPQREGVGVSLAGMARVIDYPARDMTITVEAGLVVQSLAHTLAKERQRVAIDAPHVERATIGGVVATNPIGPRCYGHGTVRDYVIGLRAVDCHGEAFKAGGRVVKNVAGYDLCKLLTGSLGTLAIIAELTFKLKPLPECTRLLVQSLSSLDEAEERLAAMVHTEASPVAIELLGGQVWRDEPALADIDPPCVDGPFCLVVGLEGMESEIQWMSQELNSQWHRQGARTIQTIEDDAAEALWTTLREFPARAGAALVLQASVLPREVTRMVRALQEFAPSCDILAHAGSGVVLARFAEFPPEGLAPMLTGHLQPLAKSVGGSIIVLACQRTSEMTRQVVWGGMGTPVELLAAIKRQFDPQNCLNPGRFVYP